MTVKMSLRWLSLLTALSLAWAAMGQQSRLGPEEFADNNFLLRVSNGIVVTVFDSASNARLDQIVLSKPAITVKGGTDASKNNLTVTIDWKDNTFKGSKMSLEGMLMRLTFANRAKQFELTKLVADQMVINGDNMRDIDMKVSTMNGYTVAAPLGTSYSCPEPGLFPQRRLEKNQNNKYRIGITFPNMRVQAFEMGPKGTFGPEWECGDLMGIGLWIGLLVTIFFALICMCGFTMLANIQTNDRFDDPKGKPIHVPQGE